MKGMGCLVVLHFKKGGFYIFEQFFTRAPGVKFLLAWISIEIFHAPGVIISKTNSVGKRNANATISFKNLFTFFHFHFLT